MAGRGRAEGGRNLAGLGRARRGAEPPAAVRGTGRTLAQLRECRAGDVFVTHTRTMAEHTRALISAHMPELAGRINVICVSEPSDLERLRGLSRTVVADHACPAWVGETLELWRCARV